MKKFLILSVFLLIYSTCHSQNIFPQNGYVGIGTLSPQFRLHMLGGHGDTNFGLQYDNGDPTRQANLTLWASEPGWSYTGTGIGNNVFNSSTGGAGIVRINTLKGGSYIRLLDQELRFNLVNLNGVDMTAMYINPSGNMGLGTLNTNKRLSVSHGSGYGQVARFSSNLEDEEVGIGTESNGFSWVGTTSHHNFQIYANNSPKISILANGNVGIGTTAPEALLHVSNGIKTGAIRIGGSNGANNGRVFIQADLINDKSYIDVYGDDTYKKLLIDASTLVLNTASNGNVGIGTDDTKGYKLAVAGNMIAESVKVKLQGTWPDYVFAQSYQLPTLQETEKHIKEKGHLPGIPSAVDVKANGVDLGEMNSKLLQKIEELTLHLIEMKKENTDMKTRMSSLEDEMKNNLKK